MKAKIVGGTRRILAMAGMTLWSFGALAQPDIAPPPQAVAAGAPALPADLSPGLSQVVKLAEANVGDDVILAYIKNSGQATSPTADEILYLKDLGLSDAVMTALLQSPSPGIVPPPAPVVEPAPALPPPVATTAPVQEVTTAYFEEQLSPYGSWIDVPDYGRCWQPTVVVVNREWQPYSDRGHWIYTDAGWFWQSDYSWGWAAFHYGRWFHHGRFGWVWAPDSTWGPSWVCWRQEESYCGWAPLPPGARFEAGIGLFYHNSRVAVNFDFGLDVGLFTFVGFDHFCDRDVHRYYVPRRDVVNIYRRSTVINNYTIVNRTVINGGIARERVATLSHRSVPQVAIHETAASAFAPGRVNHLDRKNESLTVFRPTPAVMATHVSAPRREPFVINRPAPAARTTGADHNIPVRSSRGSNPGSVAATPNRGNENVEPPRTSRNIVVHHDSPAVTTPAPSSRSTVTPPESRSENFPTRSENSFPARSGNLSTGHHAVENTPYQPRVWSGNSESGSSGSRGLTPGTVTSPHQNSGAGASCGGTSSFGHTSAPAAPSYSSPSSPRAGQDKPK